MNIILTGKSGSGKDRIIRELVEKYYYTPIISHTTRPKREGEKEGREYYFISKKKFLEYKEADYFIEYRSYNTLVNGVSDTWYYGVMKNPTYAFEVKKYAVILDLEGAKNFIKYAGRKNCKVIYVDCDDKIREERAKARGSFDQTEWNRRLEDDNKKFNEKNLNKIIDFKVSNNGDFEETMKNICSSIKEIQDIKEYIKERRINKIFLDIDGVVLHSCEAMAKILNKVYNKNVSGQDILSWNFKEVEEHIDDSVLEYLFTTDAFFDIVEPIEGAIEFIKSCPENSIVFVTKGRWQNFIGKEKLFEKLGIGNIPMIGLPMNVDKDIINMNLYDNDVERSLFIDDSTRNLVMSNATYKIQFREYKDDKEREWQKNWNGDIMYHW